MGGKQVGSQERTVENSRWTRICQEALEVHRGRPDKGMLAQGKSKAAAGVAGAAEEPQRLVAEGDTCVRVVHVRGPTLGCRDRL